LISRLLRIVLSCARSSSARSGCCSSYERGNAALVVAAPVREDLSLL
jgi:hypothetical protein